MPSVKLVSRLVFMAPPRSRCFDRLGEQPNRFDATRLVDRRLALDPFDQLVELDRLLGCGQGVGLQKVGLHRRL